ncbi:hypothetical protein TheetDRAFT_2981 [Thermoanaerobacter ethanolicus JW 200]|nr:hypothetical protein TheetDRAFT_2981 [Thermoanaerobacter ethanolicus JW 200]
MSIVSYIDGFIKWADIYMNYTISPPGFDLLTEKYRFFYDYNDRCYSNTDYYVIKYYHKELVF